MIILEKKIIQNNFKTYKNPIETVKFTRTQIKYKSTNYPRGLAVFE